MALIRAACPNYLRLKRHRFAELEVDSVEPIQYVLFGKEDGGGSTTADAITFIF